MRFLGQPACASCGIPFAFDRGLGARCAACVKTPPVHQGVRAAVAYGDIARSVALKFKYGRKTHLGALMAGHMARLMPAGIDLIVPVPLHRWRLWSRGFNQAALVAAALGKSSGVPVDVALLRRVRPTRPLRGMGRAARARMVRGAFAVVPGGKAKLAGKALLLVDDIYTSGATTDACTRCLMKAGAKSVTILAWARVLDDESGD